MNQKTIRKLQSVVGLMEITNAYLNSIVGFAKTTDDPIGCDYEIINKSCDFKMPKNIRLINHEIGCDFCNYYESYKQLKRLLESEINKKNNKQ